MKIRKLTTTLFMVMTLAACTNEEFNHSNLSDKPIMFSATVTNDWNNTRSVMQQNASAQVQPLGEGLYLHTIVSQGFENEMTRGARYTSTTLNMPFSVSGYRYANNSSVSSVSNANFFYDVTVTQVNSVWTANGNYTWPANKDLIDFHAYTPIGGTGITPRNEAGGLQIDFAIQKDVNDQIDLMTAKAEGESFTTTLGYTVDLPFSHALTSVQFVLDANVAPGIIKQVDLVDIATEGTLHISTGQWDYTKRETLTLKFCDANNEGGLSTTDTNGFIDTGKEIVSATSPLLMIPQKFLEPTQGIRVIIDTGGEQPLTLYATLCPEGVPTTWLPGETVTYKISTSTVNTLKVSEVTYPNTWETASTAFNSIKSSYVATNDVLGIYAIDVNGEVVKDNEPLTKTDTGWSSDILFVPGLTYFAYYPYSSNGLAHSGTKDNAAVATAEDFFANGISAWTPADDQSSATKLNAQDLQVGTGTIESASTISFAMAHTMGLASLTLAQGTIPEVRYFIVNANGNINENGVAGTDYIDIGEKSVDASTDFTTTDIENINTKMLVNSRKYYYVVNPHQTAITINGPTTGEGKWTSPNVELDVTAGNYKNYSVNHQGAYYYKGWLYQYRGKNQVFTVPTDGDYRVECWGASSYKMAFYSEEGNPGLGGYTRGDIALEHDQILYVYVGGEGSGTSSTGGGGWNGGGNGVCVTSYLVGGGGGATDVRLRVASTTDPTIWNNFTSLTTRIMVAGGGGAISQDGYSGAAGGLIGYRAGTNSASGYGGTQTAGGSPGTDSYVGGRASSGSFGYGSNGYSHSPGGGGGWYGGAGGTRSTIQDGGGGGGSSYISGHPGCNSVGSSPTVSNRQHTGSPNYRDEAFIFTDTKMIDGKGYEWTETAQPGTIVVQMPKPTTNENEIGHKGNGYVRISARFLEE